MKSTAAQSKTEITSKIEQAAKQATPTAAEEKKTKSEIKKQPAANQAKPVSFE